ncbi:surfactant protein B [Ancylostoma caninum]|uniref:Surfactant protein B n=1 Tax=Ancylostoma caninum TaxID=29170 RepID=A0A368FJC2_ANCCA|nr:surfactant protein B [Ancylostoma caninum]
MRSLVLLLLGAWCCMAASHIAPAGILPGLVSAEQAKFDAGELLKPLLEKLEKFLLYMCTRCQDIIKEIDSAIESEQLKNDALKLCEASLSNPGILQLCKTVVEETLGVLYKQLKKFEPKPELCSHIRLCDSCNINVTRSLMDIVPRAPDANPVLLIAKVSQLKAALTHFATSEMLNRGSPQS